MIDGKYGIKTQNYSDKKKGLSIENVNVMTYDSVLTNILVRKRIEKHWKLLNITVKNSLKLFRMDVNISCLFV